MQKLNQASGYRSRYKTILLLLAGLLLWQIGWGQRQTRQISKEIVVPNNVVVKTRGPEEVHFMGNGTVNIWREDGKQKLSAAERSPVIYELDQRLVVQSWEEDKVKQVVEVTAACATPAKTKALLDALRVSLHLNVLNEVEIGCELNIDRFMIENGWFRADNNTVELDDGQVFQIEYLALASVLYIPRQATFRLKSEWTIIEMGEHLGPVEVSMHGGQFRAKELASLEADFSSTQVQIGKVGEGELLLRAVQCELGIVDRLELSSSISTIEIGQADTLIVENLLSDELQVADAAMLLVDNARFSELGIESLGQLAKLNGRNTNFRLRGGPYEELLVDNELANVELQLNTRFNYRLELETGEQGKLILPSQALLVTEEGRRKIYSIGTGTDQRILKLNCQECEIRID